MTGDQEDPDLVFPAGDDGGSSGGDEDGDPEMEDYKEILKKLSQQWIFLEIKHRISKVASNLLWRLANDCFHQLYLAKGNRGKRIPQMAHLRRRLYSDKVPPVRLQFVYESKEDGTLTIVDNAACTPISRFPPSTYRKVYEIASVKVIWLINDISQLNPTDLFTILEPQY